MKPGLEPGKHAEIEITVTPAMCPHFDGELVHPLFSTWETVHYMEMAGRKVLAPHLDDDEEALGAHITVDHKSPALIGARVVVRAEIESLRGQRLSCRVTSKSDGRLLAAGRFVQIIMPKSRVAALLDRHAP